MILIEIFFDQYRRFMYTINKKKKIYIYIYIYISRAKFASIIQPFLNLSSQFFSRYVYSKYPQIAKSEGTDLSRICYKFISNDRKATNFTQNL